MPDSRDAVRLTVRLLSTSRLISREVDALMRTRFESTIARFDFLAALDRYGPLSLGEVSQHLLVSNGNITQLRKRLSEDGLIAIEADSADRRIQRVRLTRVGERVFEQMAKEHAACVDSLLRDLAQADKEELTRLLDVTKGSLRHRSMKGGERAWMGARHE